MDKVQLWDGKWRALPGAGVRLLHACCKCGLKHKVEFRLRDNRLEWKWRHEK